MTTGSGWIIDSDWGAADRDCLAGPGRLGLRGPTTEERQANLKSKEDLIVA